MRSECEFVPNPDIAIIHLDKRVSTMDRYFTSKEDAYTPRNIPTPYWVMALFQIRGVEEVFLGQHSVRIKKGRMFSWDTIIETALNILRKEFEEAY